MTEIKPFHYKAIHRARIIYTGKILKEWKVWDIYYLEVIL